MESKLFLEKLKLRKSKKVVSKLSYFGLTWNQWAKFTKMTSILDYGCNFNVNGKICSAHDTEVMCCCRGCLSCIGYLDLIPDNKQIIKEIAFLFDEKHGFWRKKKGCMLPTKYRSKICITYRCTDARKQRNKTNKAAVGVRAEALEQMILYFLETIRSNRLAATQIRTIIKELIKSANQYPFCNVMPNEGDNYGQNHH